MPLPDPDAPESSQPHYRVISVIGPPGQASDTELEGRLNDEAGRGFRVIASFGGKEMTRVIMERQPT